MQKIIKGAAVLALTVIVAACGGREAEDDVVVIEPIQPEPVTGKF
jgi:hypothetical protein